MPAIYSSEWYDTVRAAINARVATVKNLPGNALTIRVEIAGDGMSPYVGPDKERHFLVRIDAGRCDWYREVTADDDSTELDYRFRGPATVFDEIAAGLVDPIDAALSGTVKVRGDMRFLLRQAELVKVLLEAYAAGVETIWPEGRPPYAVVPAAVGA